MDIALKNNNTKILSLLKLTFDKDSPNQLNESIKELELFLNNNSDSNLNITNNIANLNQVNDELNSKPTTSGLQNFETIFKVPKIEKYYSKQSKYCYEIIDDSDLNTSDDDYEVDSVKKQKISLSPVQSIEDTLIWLKAQENLNSLDLLENRELSLTGKVFIYLK